MKKILVIEDQPEMRRNLTTILRLENFRALPAADGRIGLERAVQQAVPEFRPNFDSAKPLEKVLGLTPRVAETLLWLAQGKTNSEIATILGNSESTVKKHVLEVFAQLGVETRTAASLRALEILSSPATRGSRNQEVRSCGSSGGNTYGRE